MSESLPETATSTDAYPARCEITDDQLRTLYKRFVDEDDAFGQGASESWPPKDDNGIVYPLVFTPEELNDDGTLDCPNYSNTYKPFGGNLSPLESREDSGMPLCNAPLSNWRDRYPEIRYCGSTVNNVEKPYCFVHRGREDLMQTAEETLQTGVGVQSIDRFYRNVGPWKRLLAWGTFESLMGESTHNFGVEYEPKTFDFSECAEVPPSATADDELTVKCGYPTQYTDAAISLFVAAMKTVQMIAVQPKIVAANGDDEGVMERRVVQNAQLTAPPSEHDTSPQQFKTLEGWEEHHLNLPLSRIVRDRPKLLERGGIDTSVDSESSNVSDDVVLEIEADIDDVAEDATVAEEAGGTDPNYNNVGQNEFQTETEKIAAGGSTDDTDPDTESDTE